MRRMLLEATGTLDAKWGALGDCVAAGPDLHSLFSATARSAEALTTLDSQSKNAAAASRSFWAHESTQAVLDQEQALREQVFAQVRSW
jgi:hypothetical protein